MRRELIDFDDYKEYLSSVIDSLPESRGQRMKLARAIGCQPGYVSRVLSGDAHFSLEQAACVNTFLGHSQDEAHYFLLLVGNARAGTPALREYFKAQIKFARESCMDMGKRFSVKNTLSEQDQIIYFSSWHYAAVHALVSVPGFQSRDKIATRLSIPVARVTEALKFLLQTGLILGSEGKYLPGVTKLHLGKESPVISKHHVNWRLKAVGAIERRDTENVHYSSCITLSEADAVKIKSILLKAIESSKQVIATSKDESIFGLSLDFYEI